MVSVASAYTAKKKQCLATAIFDTQGEKKSLVLFLPALKKDREFETNIHNKKKHLIL